MTSCNSIMLMIMKRANLGLLDIKTLQDLFPFADSTNLLIIGLLAVVIVISGLIFFLYTRLGQAYIATGDNRDMAKSFGINTDRMEVYGAYDFKWIDCFIRLLLSANKMATLMSRKELV